eukprot:3034189-Prymnesium_polylepis.1
MLVDPPDLTDEEMNATMRLLGLSWKDEKQTAMIGTANTYDLIDQVESGDLPRHTAEGGWTR